MGPTRLWAGEWCCQNLEALSTNGSSEILPQVLACGSSDGAISILCYGANNQWEAEKINNAHTIGSSRFLAKIPKSLHHTPIYRGTWNSSCEMMTWRLLSAISFCYFILKIPGCNSVSWAPGLGAGIKRSCGPQIKLKTCRKLKKKIAQICERRLWQPS